MAVESAADRKAMLADFGEPACSGSLEILVIVDDEYVETNGMAGTRPVATCDANDACTIERGDDLVIRQALHRVVDIEQDGTGWLRLILNKT